MMQVINLLFKPNCFEKTDERGQKKLKNKIAHNVLRLCVCYFALQILQALDKICRQNNSTKPLLVDGAVN